MSGAMENGWQCISDHAWEKPLDRRAIGPGEIAADAESNATLPEHDDRLNCIGICLDGVEPGLQSARRDSQSRMPRCSASSRSSVFSVMMTCVSPG